MRPSSETTTRTPARTPPRTFLSRVGDHALLVQYATCGVLLAATVLGILVLRSARDTTDSAVEAIRLLDAAKTALASELMARDAYDKQPVRPYALMQATAQQTTVAALRALAMTPRFAAVHNLVANETLTLYAAAADTLGRPSALTPADQSLRRVSDLIINETRDAVARADAVQGWVFACAGALAGLGLGVVALLSRMTRALQRQREQRAADMAAAVCFNERRFRSLVHNTHDMVLLCDASGRIVYQSPSAETAWGYAAGGLLAQPVMAITHPQERNTLLDLGLGGLTLALPGPAVSRIDAQVLDGSGQWRDAELTANNLLGNPDVQAIVVEIRDIAQRKARERALAEAALHDELTGLPNLPLLLDRLEQALMRARRRRKPIGLIMARISAQEASTAEQVLETVGRLRLCVRTTDTLARLHDGSLAVVLEELEDEPAARAVADRIAAECNRLAHPVLPGTPTPLILGIAFGDPVHTTAATLMQEATLALHRARPGTWVMFEPNMQERALDRTELASDLRMADLRREMHIDYQPVMRLAEPMLLGFDATIRWQHPALGAVDAALFSGLADETGLCVPVARWLLEACCRQVAEWQKQSRLAPPLTLSVKVSARQFHSPSLESDVMHALEAAALAPDCLLLEISEAALLHDFEAAVARLWALRHRGVRMAIDGFGTGYSSLPMLQQLPIDALRLRLAGLAQDDGTDGLDKACALAAMATSLDMEVMAEGIDTAEQAATLLGWGCTMGQGGLYYAPLDGPAAEELVHAVARSRVVGRAKASAAPLRRRSPGHHGPDDPRREARPGPRPDWPDEAADAVQAFPDEPRPGPRSRHTAAGGSLPCRAPDRAGSSQPP